MAKKRNFKRVVIISDLHCGHRVGLTPPAWQYRPTEEDHWQAKWAKIQSECWKWYTQAITKLRPIDRLIVNGDCLDGKGSKSGGTELITTDRNKQVDMASKAIQLAKAEEIYFVRGTPYHTGIEDDWEDQLARCFQAKIGDHEWYNVNGAMFDVKHYVAPRGKKDTRPNTGADDDLWNIIWAIEDDQPRGDIIVRSHVHYHVFHGYIEKGRSHLVLTTPALQAMGTKYGARRCKGHVNYGLVYFDVYEDGSWKWQPLIADLQSQKALALTL